MRGSVIREQAFVLQRICDATLHLSSDSSVHDDPKSIAECGASHSEAATEEELLESWHVFAFSEIRRHKTARYQN